MRNIIVFILKNHFTFLFVLLELIAFTLIVQNNYFHKAGFINSSNVVTASIFNVFDNITGYLGLKEKNRILAKENEILHAQSILSYIKYSNEMFYADDTIYKQQFTYLSAKVINNSINRRNNYLTLNKGSDHGVKPEMAVISSNCIVGIVKDVSANFCTVLSVLHKDTKISAKIKKNGSFGSLIWDGEDHRVTTLRDIPKHVIVNIEDTIVTSGYSAMFPEGILIGNVIKYNIEPGDNFYTISVKLSSDFNNLSFVYIINNLMKEEQESIEEKTLEE